MVGKKELLTSLLALRKAMYFIDDGYHDKEIAELTKVSNKLYYELDENTQKSFSEWLLKKMESGEELA